MRRNSKESDDEGEFVYDGMEIPWSKGELLFGGSILGVGTR